LLSNGTARVISRLNFGLDCGGDNDEGVRHGDDGRLHENRIEFIIDLLSRLLFLYYSRRKPVPMLGSNKGTLQRGNREAYFEDFQVGPAELQKKVQNLTKMATVLFSQHIRHQGHR